MTDNGGYIYVLTNPSFPEYVKIGYADNVDERVAQLNRSECTPFAFKKYAVLHVASRLADKKVHKLIDALKPELRAKESVNGKMRIREFFAMTPQEAVEILDMIGGIYQETPEVFQQTTAEKKEQQLAEKTAVASERKSPFSFYKCGIKQGETIQFTHDPSAICKVANDREIIFDGKTVSLSSLAKKLLNSKYNVQGTLYFSYKGEILSALRKRLENEGNYVEHDQAEVTQNTNNACSEDVVLFFTEAPYPATCAWNKNGFLLKAGSKIASKLTNSCPDAIKKLREENASKIDENFLLTADILFASSSAAAKFVAGGSRNGKTCWKTASGVLLKDLQ